MTNTDPRRFAALYAALSPQLKRAVASLSPIRYAASLRASVLIASAPHDKYFPPEQSRALARSAPHVSVTVTPALQHAIPRFSLHDLAGIARFDEFLVRAMHAAG
jgi:hypothetical protein